MKLDEMPELLKPAEAATLLRTTTNTLQQDRYLRRGAPYIKIGHRVLYARADLLAYLAANRSEPR
jgi:Helix-turn-helix domain